MRVLLSGVGITGIHAYCCELRVYSDHSRAGIITAEGVYKIDVREIDPASSEAMGVHNAIVAARTDMQGALLVDGEDKVINLSRICETVDQRLQFAVMALRLSNAVCYNASQHEDN